MGWITSLVLMVVGAGAADDPGITVRVPVNEAGEVDLAELIARVAETADLPVERPESRLLLPIRGIAGILTRTLLSEALGPAVRLEVGRNELAVTLGPEFRTAGALARSAGRLHDLSERATRAADQKTAYGLHARPSYHPDRPTVCLVHGLNSSSGGFVHLFSELEQAGFGVVLYDYPFNRDLDETAPAFGRDIEAFRQRAGDTRPWVVLTHSMGALIARSYVESDDYDEGTVSALILIAPPNGGSSLARAHGFFQFLEGLQSVRGELPPGTLALMEDGLGAAADDLLPGSAFLRRLDARRRRDGVRYHILAGNVGFLDRPTRRKIESHLQNLARNAGVISGLALRAAGGLLAPLDELTDGTGDGIVTVASTRLEGVADHIVIPVNHVALIRGPLLYPDPGPVPCMPHVLRWLRAELTAEAVREDR